MGRVAVATVVSLWVISVSLLVNWIVPDPYMDEIFHIPQAQHYCQGNFRRWDPMITTPPGMYYLSLAHAGTLFPGIFFVRKAITFSDVCSTTILRSTNGVLAVLCSILFYEIITHLRPTLNERKATLYAVLLSLYPLHWFFTFLYYTDVASVTAVFAMYLACLKKNYHFSALLGVLAVIIRQTNIVWMIFVACTIVIDITFGQQRVDSKEDYSVASFRRSNYSNLRTGVKFSSSLRNRKFNGALDTVRHSRSNTSSSSAASSGLLDEIGSVLVTMWSKKREISVSLTPFLIVLLAFVAFVCWNGSVVLGAKEAHAVSLHFSQVLYFSIVSSLATAPLHFSFAQAKRILCSIRKNMPISFFQLFMALTAGVLVVHFFSIAHPYLLADNRHYPFYLWRKVINAHWLMKYLLVPLYVYSWISIFSILVKVQRKIMVLAYFLATAAVLVPASLIEFRYYTIPFYIFMLHSHIYDSQSCMLLGIMYIAVNIFTLYMFLFRSFHWDHEPGTQRFIW